MLELCVVLNLRVQLHSIQHIRSFVRHDYIAHSSPNDIP
jgi:hypothetical protein